jgi:hypothetical protein
MEFSLIRMGLGKAFVTYHNIRIKTHGRKLICLVALPISGKRIIYYPLRHFQAGFLLIFLSGRGIMPFGKADVEYILNPLLDVFCIGG